MTYFLSYAGVVAVRYARRNDESKVSLVCVAVPRFVSFFFDVFYFFNKALFLILHFVLTLFFSNSNLLF